MEQLPSVANPSKNNLSQVLGFTLFTPTYVYHQSHAIPHWLVKSSVHPVTLHTVSYTTNDPPMSELQVTPFVPGTARGILRRGRREVAANNILILTQQELSAFDIRPAGIVVVEGAPLSHPMIRLFGSGIPTVVVSKQTGRNLKEGSEVLIDGFRGRIVQPPGSGPGVTSAPKPPQAGEPLITTDGSQFALRASVSSTEDAVRAIEQGATSIGLVRSEFITPEDGRVPDAAFYENVLGGLCEAARPLPVTLRLPDITADKPVPWLKPIAGMTGPLGLQGVRLYDHEPVQGVIHAMLDAVTRLTDHYELSLIVPYVVQLDEFRRWRKTIEQCLNNDLPIGAMAETPAAVLAMPHWFEVADFVAIGCNDLMQCLFAADRDLGDLRNYLDPYSPVLHRFLRQAAEGAGENINKVQLCGLLPQLPGVLPVLIGMGFRAFSVESVMIPYLAQVINETTLSQAEVLAQKVCGASDSKQVRDLLELPEI